MDQERNKPSGVIEPIPVFRPYVGFSYNAAAKRSPFELPVKVRDIISMKRTGNVKPDFNRVREQLENYNLESLFMVGTIEQKGTLWALIDDCKGEVHMALKGNYLGKNHGKIVSVYSDSVSVIELISNGKDSWVERPRTLKIKDEGTNPCSNIESNS